MTTKDCGAHHSHSSSCNRKIIRRVICPIIIILFLIFLVIFLVWAILQPSKPRFILQDATVINFNVSGNPPKFLTSSFQITLSSRNPNDKIEIYYDRLDVYASYGNQLITSATAMPTTYQGLKEVFWSPYVGGNSVPIAPSNAVNLEQVHSLGSINLMLHLDGRVRWKVGTFITRKYHLHVRCPMFINFGNCSAGVKQQQNETLCLLSLGFNSFLAYVLYWAFFILLSVLVGVVISV